MGSSMKPFIDMLNSTEGNSTGRKDNCSMINLGGCGIDQYDFLSNWSAILFYCTIPAALLGLIGNMLTIFVRLQPSMKSSVNSLLTALAAADAGTLIFVSISVIPEIQGLRYRSVFAAYCTKIVYPLAVMFLTASIYTLILITVERYIAVCFPLSARHICTQRKAVMGILLVCLLSFLYNFPRFFETAVSYERQVGNVTVKMRGVAVAVKTFGPQYRRLYTMWSYLVVVYVIPFILLTSFNLKIIFSLRASSHARRQMSKSVPGTDQSTTLMLLLIIFLFLVCALPGFALRLHELNYYEKRRRILASQSNNEFEFLFFDTLRLKPLVVFLGSLATFLVVVNAGLNFIIYCKFSESFRKGLKSVFRKQHNSLHGSSTLRTNVSNNRDSGYHNSQTALTVSLLNGEQYDTSEAL